MNYWITSHWPPRKDRAREEETAEWWYWVFLADGYQDLGRDLQLGNRVLIYETENAPSLIERGKLIGYKTGCKAIIALTTVTSKMIENKNAEIEKHEDGRDLCWRYHFKTGSVQPTYIPLQRIRKVLGYKDRYGMRIRGGLRKLSKVQFDLLLKTAKQRL